MHEWQSKDGSGATFTNLQLVQARQVAKLHVEGISTGFISSLGIDFVTSLYEGIVQSKSSFGIVAEKNGKVVGFAAFTTNLNQLYKSIVLKKGLLFAFKLAGKMFSLRRIKRIFETLFYPARIKNMELPEAELLSIVVSPAEQGKGLGGRLIEKGFQQCQKMRIDKVKVLIGADNKPGNRLYLKSGFELIGQIVNHGVLSNIYVAQTG